MKRKQKLWLGGVVVMWRRGVVVITTAQLHSTKPELRFCAGSNPARGMLRFAMVRISDSGPGWK